MSEIVKGDVVTLKSGGPKMTVQHTGSYIMGGGPDDGAACVWFEGSKPFEKVFDRSVLKKEE